MTFKNVMIQEMIDRGMFESQAQEIMDLYVNDPRNLIEVHIWDDYANDYPNTMKNVLWIGVKEFAFQWIKDNLPEAWFRPMFEFTEQELCEQIRQKNIDTKSLEIDPEKMYDIQDIEGE